MNTIELSPVPLTLTGAGVKPTIPKRRSAVFGDPDFNPDTDLMVSQWAYNVDDDIWYYRSKKGITTVPLDNVGIIGDLEERMETAEGEIETIKTVNLDNLKFKRLAESVYQQLATDSLLDENTVYFRIPD